MTGSLPSEIGNLKSSQTLTFPENLLTGTIPDVFGNLVNLTELHLTFNQFDGPIPDSLWNLEHIDIFTASNNDVTGIVPNPFCDKLSRFQMDTSSWFVDTPKVQCACCGERAECYMWDLNFASSDDLRCPSENIVQIDYFNNYWILDYTSNITFSQKLFLTDPIRADLCLSPTGCYQLTYYEDLFSAVFGKIEEASTYDLRYSNMLNALMEHDTCDTVDICGVSFNASDPKRSGLNHLTQLVASNLDDTTSFQYNALCWMMTQDQLFYDYEICDGTLIQRYIVALLFSLSEELTNTLNSKLASISTCSWPGILCDSDQKFVESLSLNSELKGPLFTEIGLLRTLKSIDFKNIALSGTIDMDIYLSLPKLERLDLSDNDFEGSIPMELFEIPSLKHLRLSGNRLGGTLSITRLCSRSLGTF